MQWKLIHRPSKKIIGWFSKPEYAQRFIDKHYGGSTAFDIVKSVDEILENFK